MDSSLLNSSALLPPYSLQTERITHITIISTLPHEEPLSFYTQNIPHPTDSLVKTHLPSTKTTVRVTKSGKRTRHSSFSIMSPQQPKPKAQRKRQLMDAATKKEKHSDAENARLANIETSMKKLKVLLPGFNKDGMEKHQTRILEAFAVDADKELRRRKDLQARLSQLESYLQTSTIPTTISGEDQQPHLEYQGLTSTIPTNASGDIQQSHYDYQGFKNSFDDADFFNDNFDLEPTVDNWEKDIDFVNLLE